MRFAHPEMLWLLLLLPAIGLLAYLRLRSGRRALASALTPVMARRLTGHLAGRAREGRLALTLLALALLILGGARPQRGTQYVTAKRMGGDVIFALDVSESMLAEDLKPNRLQRARHEISAILDRLKGDRVGLIAFAGEAFVQCPLTLDYAAARMFLDYMTPELIPQPGTNLGEALRVAARAFSGESEGYRALVLITDGEDHAGDLTEAARAAHAAGVRVFAVGIGSDAGEPIPQRDAAGAVQGYKQDREGRVVMTRLQEGPLRELADATDGVYVRAGGTLGLNRVVDAIDRLEKRELEGGVRILYEERYAYFVWPAAVLLLLEMWVPLRRRALRVRAFGLGRVAPAAMIALGCSALLPALAPGALVRAQSPPAGGAPRNAASGGARGAPAEQGARTGELSEDQWRRLFEENEVFRGKHPDDARPFYNIGNLLHDRGEWDAAEQSYRDAGPRADERLAGRIDYNLGNTRFKKGDLQGAREAFLQALRADPENEDAKFNLELTQRRLDEVAQMSDSLQQSGEKRQEGQGEQKQQQGRQEQQNSPQQNEENQSREQEQPAGGADSSRADSEQQQQRDEGQSPPQGTDQQEEQAGAESQPEPRGGAEQAEMEEAARGDSTASPDAVQVMQILRGLEGRERELLKERFRARSRNLRVEKDW